MSIAIHRYQKSLLWWLILRMAQLAWDLKMLKNHREERKLFSKPTLFLFLYKNEQLLLIQVVFILMLDPTYYTPSQLKGMQNSQMTKFKVWKKLKNVAKTELRGNFFWTTQRARIRSWNSTKWIFVTYLGKNRKVFSKIWIGKNILMLIVGWFD